MATQVAAPPVETTSVVPSIEELRALELDWSVPVLTLWDAKVVDGT
ncbi:MAG: hypothetical protein QOD86_2733 [Miltoncostaeaceae bacterium]|jgi:hypothetical protein|nr:hypothetical protein [Miltoncostaeaceae bacterium]